MIRRTSSSFAALLLFASLAATGPVHARENQVDDGGVDAVLARGADDAPQIQIEVAGRGADDTHAELNGRGADDTHPELNGRGADDTHPELNGRGTDDTHAEVNA
jgi:hypothetical protein